MKDNKVLIEALEKTNKNIKEFMIGCMFPRQAGKTHLQDFFNTILQNNIKALSDYNKQEEQDYLKSFVGMPVDYEYACDCNTYLLNQIDQLRKTIKELKEKQVVDINKTIREELPCESIWHDIEIESPDYEREFIADDINGGHFISVNNPTRFDGDVPPEEYIKSKWAYVEDVFNRLNSKQLQSCENCKKLKEELEQEKFNSAASGMDDVYKREALQERIDICNKTEARLREEIIALKEKVKQLQSIPSEEKWERIFWQSIEIVPPLDKTILLKFKDNKYNLHHFHNSKSWISFANLENVIAWTIADEVFKFINSAILPIEEQQKVCENVCKTESANIKNEDGLLPCPFCGSEAEIRTHTYKPSSCITTYKGYQVACKGCGISTEEHKTKIKAISHWNTRQPSEPNKQITTKFTCPKCGISFEKTGAILNTTVCTCGTIMKESEPNKE